MASDDNPRSGGTSVPPRGGKRKRSTAPRPAPSARKTGGAKQQGPSARRQAVLAEQKRRRQMLMAVGAIALVIVVVGVFVGVKLAGSSGKTHGSSNISAGSGKGSSSSGGGTAVPASVLSQVTGVPVSSLAAAANNFKTGLPDPIKINGKPLTTSGLPEVLYVGAEFCPYCATERWAMVLALSKFGTFKGLTNIHSDPTDVYPNTQTFSFYKSSYASKYLKFVSVETQTVSKQTLQTPTKTQSALLEKYNQGNIPFIYFNGKAYVAEVGYNPQVLKGLSFNEIAKEISQGTSTVANNVYATAGALVSNICQLTHGQPGSVCKAFPKALTSSSV